MYKVLEHKETGEIRVVNGLTMNGIMHQLELENEGFEEIAKVTPTKEIGLAKVKELLERRSA